jgi:protein SCO1
MKSHHRSPIPIFAIFSFFLIVLHCSKQKNEGIPIDFTLDTIGKKYRFQEGTGKLRLVYFGFLSCPDVCPTTLQTITASLKSISEKEQDEIEVIYIDLDPERDTLPNIKKYLDYFREDMIPLTGSIEELNKVVSLFKAKFSKVPIDSKLKYTIDHTTSVYLVDREGKYIGKIPHGIPVEAFVGYLKKNL